MTPDQLTPTEAVKTLPQLPKSNLDDRDYKDLVNECMLRIPRYCPEWTNHNPADPGITLIEMFAWLTDQMLLRFNQVPRRQYIAYLELLGITLEAAKPAKTDITFYLSRPQSADSTRHRPIKAGTEVATERTDNQLAISFTTDRALDISRPRLSHFLIADEIPFADEGDEFSRAFANREVYDGLYAWNDDGNQDQGHAWTGGPINIFRSRPPAPKNGFYLVLNATEHPTDYPAGSAPSLAGHVITLDIRGRLAAPTGINPKHPPRQWKAWTGETWEDVLLLETHDGTFGFSFDHMGEPQDPQERGGRWGTVTLHTPLSWKKTSFDSVSGAHYEGFWLCCVCGSAPNAPQGPDSRYEQSPEFEAMTVAAIGGAVTATQCTYVENELLGESNGKPGQQFSLQSTSILDPTAEEHLVIENPGSEADVEDWQKVSDFSDSGEDSPHYTINLRTGVIQLGPLVREPQDLPKDVGLRRQIQKEGKVPRAVLSEEDHSQKQYGKVPQKGALLKIKKYRTGGGQDGDVQAGALCVLKRALPYVTHVKNHKRAKGGVDEQTLEQAIMQVPKKLRTQQRAVTQEDFETLAKENAHIQRVRCLNGEGGTVKILLIPYANETADNPGDAFVIDKELKDEVRKYLTARSLLGINIEVDQPEYVRVRVKVDISLKDSQLSDKQRAAIVQKVHWHICHFIHPTKGGWSGEGWPFDMPLHESDIVAYLHEKRIDKTEKVIDKIRSVGNVQLFTWEHTPVEEASVETVQERARPQGRWEPSGDNKLILTRSQLFYAWEHDREPVSHHHTVLIID